MGGIGSGRKPSPCGTESKYQYHFRKGEEPCQQCKDAHAKRARERYALRNKRRYGPPAPKGHRKRHKRQLLMQLKLARRQCMDCGLEITIENYFVFDLDHRDPANKAFTVSQHYWNVQTDRLIAEIEKCDLVCANCHRVRTHAKKHHLLQGDNYARH